MTRVKCSRGFAQNDWLKSAAVTADHSSNASQGTWAALYRQSHKSLYSNNKKSIV